MRLEGGEEVPKAVRVPLAGAPADVPKSASSSSRGPSRGWLATRRVARYAQVGVACHTGHILSLTIRVDACVTVTLQDTELGDDPHLPIQIGTTTRFGPRCMPTTTTPEGAT